jgi:polyisoprenyl-teichoic acid--peptidoglycan teichoic acid transferase
MPTRSTDAVDLPGDLTVRPTTRPLREPSRLSPAMRVRRAITLIVITCVVPGSAQIAAGNRRLGRWLLRAWAAAVGVVVLLGLLLVVDRSLVLSLVTSPAVLVLLALACYLAALAFPLAIADAWRLGRVGLLPPRPRWWISGLAVALMILSSGAMIGTGRRLWAGADLIDGVFGAGRASAAADGRFNVLLLGGDAGPDRVGTRPDSTTLVSIDAATGRAVLFGLPRNLENVRFPAGSAAGRLLPQGWSCGDNCLLNAIYTWGSEHRAAFGGVPDPGAEAMKEAVEGVTGLRVNYYVLIDLRGFRDLIDAMGGIRVTVTKPVPIGGGTSRVSGYLHPGTQTLDGYHALWFARSRHGANDYERMARQRCVMDAMVHQLDPATVLTRFQNIAAASRQVVSTDIPAGELATFIELAAKAKAQKISSVQFVPPLINPARPDFGAIRAKVAAAIDATRHPAAGGAASGGSRAGQGPASGPPLRTGPAGGPGPAGASGGGAPSPSAGEVPAETADISAICSPA